MLHSMKQASLRVEFLQNHASLKQLPFLGKKTVPAVLRKDLWHPFAMVEFPRPVQGLIAYRKLREFRRLHETTYPLEIITEKEGPHKGQLMGTKKRGKVLMNQKANTVADLAAVLLQQDRAPTTEQMERSKRRLKLVERMKKQKGANKVKKKPVPATELSGTDGVMVRWANILDAEYAETWPAAVVHNLLAQSRYTAAFPLAEEATSSATLERLETEAEAEDSDTEQPSNRIDRVEQAVPLAQQVAATQPVSASQAAAAAPPPP